MVLMEIARDGRPGLATLEPGDGEAVNRLFDKLSPESIYRRFFSPVQGPDRLRASLVRLDHHDCEAVAAVEGGEVVAVAQWSRQAGSRDADLAIVVADDWQRQGLGTRLVAALAARAAVEGIARFSVDIQGDNFGALRLFKRTAPGARMTFSGGIGEGFIQVAGGEDK
jgi:GNAT superfamily N-acetyltransferase